MPPVDETHDDLLKLVEHDFGPLPEVGNQVAARNHQIWVRAGRLGSPPPSRWSKASSIERKDIEHRLILSWMQNRARLIPPRQRTPQVSDRARQDAIQFPVIYKIIDEVCNAGDVSPYLSRNTFVNKGWNQSIDPLFSAFQLCHFHLGNLFVNSKMAKGTKKLLFGTVSRNKFKIIGVFDHNFGASELLDEWVNFFPDDFIPLSINGVKKYNDDWTFKKIRKFVQSGSNVMIDVNGQTCMPKSLGVATSGHAVRIVNHNTQMRQRLHQLKEAKGPIVIFPSRLGIKYRTSGEIDVYDKDLGELYFSMQALH